MLKILFFTVSVFSIPFIFIRKQMGKSHPNLLDGKKFLIIAHRGASAHAPENTIESFRLAKDLGADYIELDIQMSKDGHLIVMHDLTVDRTTDGTGNVKDLTLEEIKRLDAGSWFSDEFKGAKVPTLEEVFETFGHDINYKIEIKHPQIYVGIEEKLLRLLDKYHLTGNVAAKGKVIIQSFDEDSLKKIHGIDDSFPLIQLMRKNEMDKYNLEEVKEYAIGVGPNHVAIDKTFIQRARNLGLLVHPFTINDIETINRLKKQGITSVITDDLKLIGKIEDLK